MKKHHIWKRIAAAVLTAAMVISAAPQELRADERTVEESVKGKEADLIIKSAWDMREFATKVNNSEDGYSGRLVKLANDIQFDGKDNFTPIKDFRGTFDGSGYTISGLDIISTDWRVGLFASSSGVIKNLTIKDSVIDAGDAERSYEYAGAVVGDGEGASIINCHNVKTKITVVGTYDIYAGGVAGKAGSIVNCSSSGSVNITSSRSSTYAGGIAGWAVSIYNSYNSGTVENVEGYAGGVVGKAGTIENCYNVGSVSGGSAAGIACEVDIRAYYNYCAKESAKQGFCIMDGKERDNEAFSLSEMQTADFEARLNANRGSSHSDWMPWELRSDAGYPYPGFVSAVRITDAVITLSADRLPYNFKEQFPGVSVVYDGAILTQDVDYQLSYEKNQEPGTATVSIEGLGRYIGSTELTFEIVPAEISTADISLSSNSFVYNGNEIEPEVTVKFAGEWLEEDEDYYITYQDNLYAGTASVIVTGIGDYFMGTAVIPFEITRRKQTISVNKKITKTYKDASFYLGAYAVGGSLTYKSSDPKVASVNASTGFVTIKGTGMTIITVTAPETGGYFGDKAEVVLDVRPARQTVSVSSVKNKAFTVKWKKDSKVTGYQIQYATSANFKQNRKTVEIKKNTTKSRKITKLKKGKFYYVRVRSYKTSKVNGKNVTLYGDWSTTVKSKKVK